MAEVEEILKRIEAHKGVTGTIVLNPEHTVRTTMDYSSTVRKGRRLFNFTMKTSSTIREIDPQDELTCLRISTKKDEVLVAPENDHLLIVFQRNPHA